MKPSDLPNLISALRILLILPVIVLLVREQFVLALVLFVVAGVSDVVDGYLARRYGWSSWLGGWLDPVADKLMVAVALAVLIQEHAAILLTIPATVIIGREIVISALREWMAEIGSRASVAVSYIGKIKTTAQMAAIVGLLAFPPGVGWAGGGRGVRASAPRAGAAGCGDELTFALFATGAGFTTRSSPAAGSGAGAAAPRIQTPPSPRARR